MTTTSHVPADTTMMRIVHSALRRDITRAMTALADPGRGPDRRRAIGAHLGWMMRFLHAHHASEDEGLYPLVRQRADGDPDVVEVLDRMGRQHDHVAAAIDAVGAVSAALAERPSDEGARETVTALRGLEEVLLPHLQEEEAVAMPIVSRLITADEWEAIDKQYNLDPKSMSELAFAGHWLIDGASEADRATVTRLVPPVPRFFLLHALARPYRRNAEACWGTEQHAALRVQMDNHVAVTVDAGIDAVWEIVRDVTRVGEWSHECVGAAWLAPSTAAVPGARFRGRNRAGIFRWGRVCEITSAEPFELVWVTVPTALYPDSSEWRIRLEEVDGGTRITQQFHVLRAPKVLSVLYALVIPAHRDRTTALAEDLQRLGRVAAHSPAGGADEGRASLHRR